MKMHSKKEYLLFMEAWVLLAFSRALILFRPFRSLTPILGKSIDEKNSDSYLVEQSTDLKLLQLIQCSILRAARRSPWRTMCFEQALTARIMLLSRGNRSVIFFGVDRQNNEEKAMKAHAWLISEGFTVTGGKNNSDYTIVGRFEK